MAKYQITAPCYVRGKYLGQFATYSDPVAIEVPDDHVPSRTWAPLDEAAQKALIDLGKKRLGLLSEGLDPAKDKGRLDRLAQDIRREYDKPIPVKVEKKAPVREINTNTEISEAKGSKVVGRSSDKSPV